MPDAENQAPEKTEPGNVVTFKDQAYAVATQVPGLDAGSLANARRLVGVDYRGREPI